MENDVTRAPAIILDHYWSDFVPLMHGGLPFVLTLFLFSLDILQKYARCLDQLNIHQSIVQIQNASEVLEDILLDEVVHEILVEFF